VCVTKHYSFIFVTMKECLHLQIIGSIKSTKCTNILIVIWMKSHLLNFVVNVNLTIKLFQSLFLWHFYSHMIYVVSLQIEDVFFVEHQYIWLHSITSIFLNYGVGTMSMCFMLTPNFLQFFFVYIDVYFKI